MSKRDPKLYLQDIEDSIAKIEAYAADFDFDEFCQDRKTIDAIVRNLEIMGEAVKNLPEEIKSKNPDIPWGEVIGMRNKATREYWGIDEEILWKTIKEDLPDFKKQIKGLMM